MKLYSYSQLVFQSGLNLVIATTGICIRFYFLDTHHVVFFCDFSAPGFSYWISQGEKYHGISHDSSLDKYNDKYRRKPRCEVILSEQSGDEDTEYTSIKAQNCKSFKWFSTICCHHPSYTLLTILGLFLHFSDFSHHILCQLRHPCRYVKSIS